MGLDEEAVEILQCIMDLVMPGAEVYVVENELAESVELGITVGIVVSTTMSLEQVSDYKDGDWGDVLAQLVEAMRESALELSKPTTKLTEKNLREIDRTMDDRSKNE